MSRDGAAFTWPGRYRAVLEAVEVEGLEVEVERLQVQSIELRLSLNLK